MCNMKYNYKINYLWTILKELEQWIDSPLLHEVKLQKKLFKTLLKKLELWIDTPHLSIGRKIVHDQMHHF